MEVGQLARLERGARHLVRRAVHAVGAIVHADVGHEHLEQRDAAPVGREAVAAAGGQRVAELALLGVAVDARRRAGNVVLSSVGENLELGNQIHSSIRSSDQMFAGMFVRIWYAYECSKSRVGKRSRTRILPLLAACGGCAGFRSCWSGISHGACGSVLVVRGRFMLSDEPARRAFSRFPLSLDGSEDSLRDEQGYTDACMI